MVEEKNPAITTRLTPRLKKAIDEYLARDAHISYGDLVRDALRDKLLREAPVIYKEMLEEGEG